MKNYDVYHKLNMTSIIVLITEHSVICNQNIHQKPMSSENLILYFISGIVLVGAGMLVSHLLAPSSKNPQKEETYECGIPTEGTSWFQFKVGYYLFAILFLVFEIEVIFLFPWAVVMKDTGITAFIEIFIFLFILGAGLLYAWKKGALKWE